MLRLFSMKFPSKAKSYWSSRIRVWCRRGLSLSYDGVSCKFPKHYKKKELPMATPLLHSNITFIFINIEALLFNPPVLSCHSFRLSDFLLAEMANSGPVSIIYGVVQTIIENLGSQILHEIGKIRDVKNELEKLRKTVSRIQSVLKDAEEQQSCSHLVKDLIHKLEDAVK